MRDVMISIILPTYNRAYILGKAIESVLKQTYPYFELIIVDDGSTDHTKELVKDYRDKRICYYKLEENGGQAKARNFGIAHARYDYIAFEDSDDIWYPDKLKIQMQAMAEAPEEIGFCYHKIRYETEELGTVILPFERIDLKKKSGDIYAQLLYDNLVPCPSILARKECLIKSGGFDTSMNSLEDYDLALKMAKNYHALFINTILLEASYFENGVSGNSVNFLAASCYLIQKYKEDYLRTNMLNHRVEVLLRDAELIGVKDQIVRLLELSLR